MEPRDPSAWWLFDLLTSVAEMMDEGEWSSEDEGGDEEEGEGGEEEGAIPMATILPDNGVHWAQPIQVVIHDGEEWEFEEITDSESDSDDDNNNNNNN